MTKHILLTGPPGIGKTTIVQKVCSILQSQGVEVNGFYTKELRDNANQRIGFDIVTLDNKIAKLARKLGDNIEARPKFKLGQYAVYPDQIDNIVVPIIHEDKSNFLIIDEIGKMELFSDNFKKCVQEVFHKSIRPILATIPIPKGKPIDLIEALRNDVNCTVTKFNRNELPTEIITHFKLQ